MLNTHPTPCRDRKARILVVDDHPIVREGLTGLLNRQPDISCCATVGIANEACAAVEVHGADLAIVDLRLGNADGLELIKSLKARFPRLRILVFSQLDQATFAERVLRAGAHGFVMKDQATEELLGAIRSVLGGDVYVPRSVALNILRSAVGGGAEHLRSGVECLTDRELHILRLLAEGLGSKQIAEHLHLSPKTVDTHRENMKRKLNLPNASALTRYAVLWARQSVAVPGKGS